MHRNIIIKVAVVGFLSLLLLIPLAMIRGVVHERQNYRYSAQTDIATSWSDAQTIIGPFVEVAYDEKVAIKVYDKQRKEILTRHEWQKRKIHLLPETLQIEGDVQTEERYRGIYTFPVYTSLLQLKGNFKTKEMLGLERAPENYRFHGASLFVGIADVRGIKDQLSLRWDGTNKEFQPGADGVVLESGVHAPLGKLNISSPKDLAFQFNLELRGMQAIRVAPVGKTTTVTLNSPWPHPKFSGRFLPETREISDQGFTATWQTTHFATNSPQLLRSCGGSAGTADSNSCYEFRSKLLGVELYNPVDVYQQTERSLKYGCLFILLTFTAFFLFEILRQLRIHSIQYTLVGCGLAIFYLLLVSLSEHIAFATAYAIASIACVSLISFYVCYVLKSARAGLCFGAGIAFLYGILYVLLQAQDHALIMGSALLFIALATVMITTRKIDWYQIANPDRSET